MFAAMGLLAVHICASINVFLLSKEPVTVDNGLNGPRVAFQLLNAKLSGRNVVADKP